MNIWKEYLKITGWTVDITVPHRDKCVICVAPHTSNLDFLLGVAAYYSRGWKANFLMKKFWFFFPLGYLLKALGGIPVDRGNGKKGSLTDSVIRLFESEPYVNLAVTPEGTRSLTNRWRTGFLYIAYGAKVPIQLGVLDYHEKKIIIREEYSPTGNVDADMEYIRSYYRQFPLAARYPSKFKA